MYLLPRGARANQAIISGPISGRAVNLVSIARTGGGDTRYRLVCKGAIVEAKPDVK
jgi:hypothetical protein